MTPRSTRNPKNFRNSIFFPIIKQQQQNSFFLFYTFLDLLYYLTRFVVFCFLNWYFLRFAWLSNTFLWLKLVLKFNNLSWLFFFSCTTSSSWYKGNEVLINIFLICSSIYCWQFCAFFFYKKKLIFLSTML